MVLFFFPCSLAPPRTSYTSCSLSLFLLPPKKEKHEKKITMPPLKGVKHLPANPRKIGLDMKKLKAVAKGAERDSRVVADSKIADRQRMMRKWNRYGKLPRASTWPLTVPPRFWIEEYKEEQVDPEAVWLGMCDDDDDDAKEHCKIFLQWYVQTSGRYEACLGPEEYQWAREVGSAVTVLELWKNLVVEADLTILWKKRQEARKNRRHWMFFRRRRQDGACRGSVQSTSASFSFPFFLHRVS